MDITFISENPFIGEPNCQREEANEQDPYAVAIVKRNSWAQGSWPKVGHVPRISAAYYIKQT